MATTKDNKNSNYGSKEELNNVFNMIKNSKASWFTKTLAFIALPFVVTYMFLCGFVQLILYPILYVVLTIIYDFDFREEVAYHMRKVWSISYWT